MRSRLVSGTLPQCHPARNGSLRGIACLAARFVALTHGSPVVGWIVGWSPKAESRKLADLDRIAVDKLLVFSVWFRAHI